ECPPSTVVSRWSLVVSKQLQSTTNSERLPTIDQRLLLSPFPASAPAWYAPASGSRRSDPSATIWLARIAHCYLFSSALPVARPASQRPTSCRRPALAKLRPALAHPAVQSHSAHPAPSNAPRDSNRSPTHTSALPALANLRTPASAHPPSPCALPSCSCCAPQTTAIAGCAGRSASLALPGSKPCRT